MHDSGRQQEPNDYGIAIGKEYYIAVRQFKQQIIPGGLWKTITGPNDTYPATTIGSYGPASDDLPDSSAFGGPTGVAPAPDSQFNYPAYTVEKLKDTRTTVNRIKNMVDANGNTHPTALPFAPKAAILGTMYVAGVPTVTLWSDPVTTNIASNTSEQLNINNTTVDGRPIHVHLVGFKVFGRTIVGGGPSLNVTAPGGIQPWEDGWKDTVITYPGEVTSIAENFDINGLYVWHCHILEHEDNKMMVPMCVGTKGVDCPSEVL